MLFLSLCLYFSLFVVILYNLLAKTMLVDILIPLIHFTFLHFSDCNDLLFAIGAGCQNFAPNFFWVILLLGKNGKYSHTFLYARISICPYRN